MDTLTGRFGPREIAQGVAFGLFLGLMIGFPPKFNLLILLTGLVFFLSHANIVVGLAVTAIAALLAPWGYPFFHRIGGEVLTSSFGQETGAALFRIPVLPWTMLDNTIVLGSFLVGLALFLPVFVVVWIPLKIVWPRTKEMPNEKPPADEERTAGK